MFENPGEWRREQFFRLARRRPVAMGEPTEPDEDAARLDKGRGSLLLRCSQRLIGSAELFPTPPPVGYSNTAWGSPSCKGRAMSCEVSSQIGPAPRQIVQTITQIIIGNLRDGLP